MRMGVMVKVEGRDGGEVEVGDEDVDEGWDKGGDKGERVG